MVTVLSSMPLVVIGREEFAERFNEDLGRLKIEGFFFSAIGVAGLNGAGEGCGRTRSLPS